MRRWLAMLVLILSLPRASAVVFYATGDPTYNTSAPTGALTGSGWQYEGRWGIYVGTAIAPRYFITAKHVEGAVGDPFTLNDSVYTTTASFAHPTADLRIWRVRESLPVAAPLYSRHDEKGRALVVHGRGAQRGGPVTVESRYGHSLKGWYWGTEDHLLRWGENQVSEVFLDDVVQAYGLMITFYANGGANEAGLSSGDSGGGIFIQENSTWKLAGINWATDGHFNTTTEGDGFYASLFDLGGVYQMGETNWVFTEELPARQPSHYYATRISYYVDWIQQILAQTIPPEVLVADRPDGGYALAADATVDTATHTVRVPVSNGPRFYRLRDDTARRITQTTVAKGFVVLDYE